jgi:hypothetical protein
VIDLKYLVNLVSSGAATQHGPRYPHSRGFRSHTTTHHSRWDSSRRVISSSRGLYLTTHKAHNRHTFMFPGGFKSTISAVQDTAELRLRQHCHMDKQNLVNRPVKNKVVSKCKNTVGCSDKLEQLEFEITLISFCFIFL